MKQNCCNICAVRQFEVKETEIEIKMSTLLIHTISIMMGSE